MFDTNPRFKAEFVFDANTKFESELKNVCVDANTKSEPDFVFGANAKFEKVFVFDTKFETGPKEMF